MPSGGFVRVESQKIYDTDLMAWVALSTSGGVGGDVVVTNIPHVIVDSLPPSSGGLTDAELRATPVPMSLATAPTTPVTGTFWQATQPVSGTVTADPTFPATAAVTSVAASASNVTLKASNAARRGLSVYNDSSAILYVKFGATASSSSYTIQMAANSYYELPQPCYTGIIDGIWASATGNARITEVT